MLQRRRYFCRSKRATNVTSLPHACLQSAMWTLASVVSSQFQHLCQPLYNETLQKLSHAAHTHGLNQASSQLDLARAWVLVSVYEFMHCAFERAWASTGHAIRLVQLLRLNAVNASRSNEDFDSFIDKEERRRVFWVVFCLDRFSCAFKGLLLTLNEHPVC